VNDRPVAKALAHLHPVLDNALAPGDNIDVGRLGKRDVIGRAGEVLIVAMRLPDILDTSSLCRRRLRAQEYPSHCPDTEQDGEQSCEQMPELRAMFHGVSSMPRVRHTSFRFQYSTLRKSENSL
jgi:hypothetical protein